MGKFLFAARRYRLGAHIEYIISLDADDLSQGIQIFWAPALLSLIVGHLTVVQSLQAVEPVGDLQACKSAPSSSWQFREVYDKHLDDTKMKMPANAASGHTVLKNKAPRWHDHLQCWFLNFHGWVIVALVENFKLCATVDPSQPGGKGDEETVVLQFGKVGDDTFTMDYRQPLSAFLAFTMSYKLWQIM
ncbi:Tubby like protein 7 isoform 3 [Hibiscus syriacus]|uniref:Tubby like protein 7 isoform 3 n=1 Tax=Hibiscus syriacus TaxID=106335 RepID=A0A6A2ZID1_HIBSY|nr:Tubby like protein 7 isoform 3 [Hibiscus syriacus]